MPTPPDSNATFTENIMVNATSSPENVTVCFDIATPCIDPTLIVLYVPIDYDGMDESNEYVKISKGIYSYDCARNVANNCSTIETCGPYSFGSSWSTSDACVTFEIGAGVDKQCNNAFGLDISDRTFFGFAELYCGSHGFSSANIIKENVFTDIKYLVNLKYGIILIVAASVIGCIIVIICCIVFRYINRKICKKNTVKYTAIKADSHASKSEFMSEGLH